MPFITIMRVMVFSHNLMGNPMKTKLILALAASISLSACATKPENITPQYVSTLQYKDLSCSQLGVELARTEEALTVASGEQKKARSNDTLGVLFLGVPVSSLSGSNKAAYIGQLKGQVEAMNKVATLNNC